MADITTRAVVQYVSDISDIISKAKTIQRVNQTLAKQIGTDFSKGFDVIDSRLAKTQFHKKFKIKIDDKKFKTVTGTVKTFEKTIQTADGHLYRFTETIGYSNKGAIQLSSSIKRLEQAQNKLIGASSKLQTNFTNLSDINAKFNKELRGFGATSKFVGTSLNQVSDSGSKVSKIFETTSGKFVQLTETTKKLPGGVQQVTRSVKQLSKEQLQNIRTLEGTNKATRSLGQNFLTLAKRAALTIPLWFALRRGIGAIFRTLKEGLTAIVDFDRALQKAKRNLQGSAQSIERNFGILRKEVTKLSIETGRSVEDITQAFQKFATVGFDFETSLAGANAATKLSILLFGDVKETAFAFARSMRVLVDETEGAAPASQQLAEVMALTNELWKTNAFELNELTQSLEKFAPAAKTAGFSAQETVKILAALSTAGLRAGRAGRLLRTSMTRLLTSTDKLAKSLGVKVNPEVDRTYDVFLRTLDALAKTRSEAGKVSPAFEKIVKSIFGLRSADAIKGLIALRKNLQKVLGVTGDVSKFNKEFAELNKTIPQLVDQFRNLNKEMGKAFVTGLVGGGDFRDSLEEIVELQNKILKITRQIGKAFKISAQITFGETQRAGGAFKEIGVLLWNMTTGAKEAKDKLKEINNEILENNEKLLKGLEGQLNRTELERLIFEIETQIKLDTKQFDIDKSILIKAKKALEEQFEELDPIEPTIKIKLAGVDITREEESELIKSIIDDQLKRLKLEGALESQLLKTEDRLRKQYDETYKIIDQKQKQLDIERSISEEQRLRNQLSSESVKLYRIAKEEGTGIARKIGEVLSGQRDFNSFLKAGGKEVEVFKKQFAGVVEQQQALRFFKGDIIVGEPKLRGGYGIPIREEELRRPTLPSRVEARVELSQLRLGVTKENISALQQNTASLQSLIEAYHQGVTLYGDSSQRIVEAITKIEAAQALPRMIANLPVGQVTTAGFVPQKQMIDFNITVDGRNLDLTFNSKEEARNILSNLLSDDRTIERIVDSIPFQKATDERINDF